MKSIYLITGAAGFLGNTIVSKLLQRGKQVRALVLPQETMPFKDQKLEIVKGDVTKKDSLKIFFGGLDYDQVFVIHCAGIVSIASKYDQKVYDVNVKGTKNIMDLCLSHQVTKVIHISSVHAIKEQPKGKTIKEVTSFDPNTVEGLYAQTKAEASQYVLDMAKKGLAVVIVHPSGIIGPGNYGRDHLSQVIVDYMNHHLTALVHGGYDFVDVRDVAAGILAALESGRVGECYILSNRFFEIREIITMLHEITGKKDIHTILPLWFAKLTAPLSEIYYKLKKQPPLYTSYSLYTLASNANFSHEKATQELGYQPRKMKETLTDTVAWLKQRGRIE